MVNVTIDGKSVQVPEKTTILRAAASIGIEIPNLCYWEGLNEIGACRVCVVEVEGYERLFTACNNTVKDGMVIWTNSKKARETRKTNVQLILSEHNSNCATCVKADTCALRKMANDFNIQELPYDKKLPTQKGNKEFPLIRDYQKCIKCMRCVQICDKIQNTHIWDVINTGAKTTVDVANAYRLEDSKCVLCGQCIVHCPVGALKERDDTDQLYEALHDPDKIVIAQLAPAVRTAWGEPFNMSPQFANVNRLAAALHTIGFDHVFDTDFTADLTIMEEASELIEKIIHKDEEGNKFPLFTSCCPGWLRYMKGFFPQLIPQISTAKSPQQMFGALAKTYYAEKLGVDPKRIVSVSIMPCLAKKMECSYPSMVGENGDPDVDFVLTTREVARLIRAEHVNVAFLPEEELDMPFGLGSGAGNIFGASGGVMEAALRTAYYMVTGSNPNPDAFREVRGMHGWKEADFRIADISLKVAVVDGLSNANKLIRMLLSGEVHYDMVEVMACPGGCVGGGGQPVYNGYEKAADRAPVLYEQDHRNTLRFSHENPLIKKIYKEYLGKPLSERSEKLLHTDHTLWKMPGEK